MIYELTIFASGAMVGMVIAFISETVARRAKDRVAIKASDPINVRRREFSKLKGEVDAVYRMIEEFDERIRYIEKS